MERKDTPNRYPEWCEELVFKESITFLHEIINNLPFDVFALDKNEVYILQNEACRQNWGDIVGKHPEDVANNEETLRIWKTNNSRVLAGETLKEERSFEFGGNIRHVYNILSPINLPAKKQDRDDFQTLILGINIDITGLIQAQNKLRESQENLKKSEEMYKLITENTYDMIAILGNDNIVEFVNDSSHVKNMGRSMEDLVGKWFGMLVHQDDIATLEDCWKAVREGSLEEKRQVEFRLNYKSTKEYQWYESVIIPVIDAKNQRKILMTTRNISERKQLADFLEEENKRLMELDEFRKTFIMNATHELKTPLMAIWGASKYIKENMQSSIDARATKLLEHVWRGSDRLKSLIENLLSISSFESGKVELDIQEADIHAVIRNAIDNIQYKISENDDTIETSISGICMIEMDPARVEQVIMNLLTNAIKNTPNHSTIKIQVKEGERYLDVSVIDNGIGITTDEMRLLFTKFGKIDRANEKTGIDIQGSGIGLYLSKEIVELHGGIIFAESTGRNQGSTFTVRLPKKITGGSLS